MQRHERQAAKLGLEAHELEGLWSHQRVVNLIQRLTKGPDAAAQRALAELNRIWQQIDFKNFIPYALLSAEHQKRVLHYLSVMASTAQLGEARNAFDFVGKILKGYEREWRQAA